MIIRWTCLSLFLVWFAPVHAQGIPYELVDFDGDGTVTSSDTIAAQWYEGSVGSLADLLTELDAGTGLYDVSGHLNAEIRSSSNGSSSGSEAAPNLAADATDVAELSALYTVDPALSYCRFLRGDVNIDGSTNLFDGLFLLAYLFNGGVPPTNMDSGDANDDGIVQLPDAMLILNYANLGGAPPSSPFPDPGYDLTNDDFATECNGYLDKVQSVAFRDLIENLNLTSSDLEAGIYEEDITGDGYKDLILNLQTGVKAYAFDSNTDSYSYLQDLTFPADLILSDDLADTAVPNLIVVAGGTVSIYPAQDIVGELALATHSDPCYDSNYVLLAVSQISDGLLVWFGQTNVYYWLERNATGSFVSLVQNVVPGAGGLVLPERVVPALGTGEVDPRSFVIKYSAGVAPYAVFSVTSAGLLGAIDPTSLARIPWLAFHPEDDLLPPSSLPPTGTVIPRPSPGWGAWNHQHIDVQISKDTTIAGPLLAAGTNQGTQEFKFPWFHVGSFVSNTNAPTITINIGLAQRVCGFSGDFRSTEYMISNNKAVEAPNTARVSTFMRDYSEQPTGIWDTGQGNDPPYYPEVPGNAATGKLKGTNTQINSALSGIAKPRVELSAANGQTAVLLIRDRPSFTVPSGHNLEWRKKDPNTFPTGKLVAVTSAETYVRFSDHVITKSATDGYYMATGYRTFGIMATHNIKKAYLLNRLDFDVLGDQLDDDTGRVYRSVAYAFVDDAKFPVGGTDAYRADSIPIVGVGNDKIAEAIQNAVVTPE